MSYQREYTISTGLPGLVPSYQLWDTTGAPVGSEVSTGAETETPGTYALLVTIPAAHRGGVTFYGTGTPLESVAINPEESESAPADVWAYGARTLTSSGPVAVSSPWQADGTLTLAEGAAYTAALGTRLPPLVLNSAAPDLTGKTLTFEAAIAGQPARVTTDVTVSGPPSAQSLQIGDLPSADTAALEPAPVAYLFTIWMAATPPGADRWPVVRGTLVVAAMA